MAIPILKLIEQQGYELFLLTEGRATGFCDEAGLTINQRGSDDCQRFSGVADTLNNIKPNLVLVGTSWPINWELDFAQGAQRLGIPVAALEDIWGGLSRLQGLIPDLALVMDDIAARQVTERGLARQTVIVGDIASITNTTILNTAGAEEAKLRALAQDYITVLIVGDHTRNALEVVRLVAESIRMEAYPERFIITHSLVHPKLVNTPDGQAILEPAADLLKGLRVEQFPGVSTDARAARCHYTCTCFSTPLRIALHNQRRAISVQGPQSLRLLREETGLEQYPLVTAGVVPVLTVPTRLGNLRGSSFPDWAANATFRPEAALGPMLELVH